MVDLLVGSELRSLMDERPHSSSNLCKCAVIQTGTSVNSWAGGATWPFRAQGVGDRADLFVSLTAKDRTEGGNRKLNGSHHVTRDDIYLKRHIRISDLRLVLMINVIRCDEKA